MMHFFSASEVTTLWRYTNLFIIIIIIINLRESSNAMSDFIPVLHHYIMTIYSGPSKRKLQGMLKSNSLSNNNKQVIPVSVSEMF